MAARAERSTESASSTASARTFASWAALAFAGLGASAGIAAAVVGWDGRAAIHLAWAGLTLVWGVAGTALLLRPGNARLGLLALWFSVLSGAASLATALAGDAQADDAALLAQALAIALLPAASLHVLLALPSGALATRASVLTVGSGYAIAAVLGVVLWAERPSIPAWPVVIEAVVAAAVGVSGATARYRVTRGTERRRLHWVALGIALAAEIVLVGSILHVLVGWPPSLLQIAAAATFPVPLALLPATSRRVHGAAGRLVARAISLAGLTALVASVYLVVVVGLGRPPTHDERTLLVLSIAGAGISALLFVPARQRLAAFSNRLVHGERQAPDELVRAFGARLSRAVPLEELLLQLAESLRLALGLDAVEIWTGSDGALERLVSDPDRGPASLRLTASDAAVVARSAVSGPARVAVWLPELLLGRGDLDIRVAPIAHTGELFGLIVAERTAEPFDDETESVLAELSPQVGLALRNAQLDSELQASLDELRRQADELRASRARVVAAGDAERRRIERDLHDGAQQYLVGVAANLGVVRGLTDSEPERAKVLLDELQDSIREAMQAFRELAHGIYPPLLQDRGLAEALADAARQATVPTRVVAAGGVGRYDAGVEATVYFCCLEALQNAAKHAGEDARATVRVWEEEDGLLFEVADDGAGLDPARGRPGAGLANMQDRLSSVGGSLRIESAPGRGTKVVGAIPLPTRYSRSAR